MIGLRLGIPTVALAAIVFALSARVHTHDGPPFPIVSRHIAGPYEIAVWTDPDATDDGSPGGQFWVLIQLTDGATLPPDTRALVTIRPLDRAGAAQSARTTPVEGNAARQFAAVLMDHEGRFAVQTTISGARGTAVVDAHVDATYDLRPPLTMVAIYMIPFVAVGLIWLKVLLTRRRARRPPAQRREPA